MIPTFLFSGNMTKTLLIGGAVVGGLILLSSMNKSQPAKAVQPVNPKQPAMNGLKKDKKKTTTGKTKKSAVLKV